MKRHAYAAALLLIASSQSGLAQQAGVNLTEQQKAGRQVLAQSCGVCHLSPSLNARTYGPPLNNASANGDNDIMREYILNGTPRMPAFRHYLNGTEIDSIVAYLKTVPTPPPGTRARPGRRRRIGGTP